MESIKLYARINELRAQALAVPEDAADRADQLMEIQGRISEATAQLGVALESENEAREAMQAAAAPVGGGTRPRSLTEMAFGMRSEFTGIQPGFKAAVTIPAGPDLVDPTIPGFPDLPRGFADTLMQASTTGAVQYLRRGAKTNAAAQWASGNKAESAYVWTEHTAPLAWIAHHAPISKTQASDWGQLDGIIRGEMMIGLAQAKSAAALTAAEASGVTGIINTVGIQTHTVASGDNAYDAIRRMVTKVYLTSGFYPTHVAVSPQVNEELDLLKDDNKQYLQVKIGNKVWSLEIVEDNGLTIVDDVDTTHYGAMVYANVGATWYTKESDNVEMGLVNAQFIQNAYTLLAEGRHALAVRFPDAFCYCEDAIPEVASAVS